MNTEIFGVVAVFLLTIVLAIPVGKYIAKVYLGDKTFLDPIFNPIERFIFKISGINDKEEMNWKQHLKALLSVNLGWFILCFFVLLFQGNLPLNPDGNPSMSPDLAFNTAISFVVNCNLQHYSGETGLSYLGQLMLMFLQFVSAGVGMAAAAMVFNAMKERTTEHLGNFYNYFIKSCTRILLPLSAIVAVILIFSGTPMTFEGKDSITTLQGDTVEVSRGPAAAFIGIKHIGTNGGGFFGVNSAHPFENPTYFTNAVELWAQLIIPLAMIFALGFYLKKRKLSYVVFGVMTIGFLLLVIPTISSELSGNPAIAKMGITQATGSMEGKEVRFGPAISGFWSIATTVISTGSVNSMHDSSMAMSGAMQLLSMMVNAFYGGCGVGWLNFYVFIILAVFISGLMVGRTPEFLGKKIEAREVKIAAFIAILHPLLILSGTALASYFAANDTAMGYWFSGNATGWLNNPGNHGFSEMLYEFTSSAANNGSGFEGLGDNNPFWNITTGIVLLLGRFLPIIGPLAIAGLLANKKYIPESAGTLKTDTTIFGVMVFAVIAIIAALSFFPALALGPLAEYFSLR
ncbi:potassium-transporting ATPase subunit KdpA [Flavobacterium celericrescens]|uniref:Potassium-transporting ATPase potassium-binding subunit n=1 Tax=Flavobacterium celericrescens TaxID=2709780 RepID=A0ABX0IEL6_9FLAO|nr:potassium-transporting ATPase subunit KdpA [Flavobacterium celericrescens]NHM04107.1 potassium-transporting ATPase subunit KdpA [Flavobacterium celericrescens]